jgi:chemotaxis signal transduction protein
MAGDSMEYFLVARIGGSNRLIELALIREIVPAMELSAPPGVGGVCSGVANVRGDVVPVFDMLSRGKELAVTQLIVITHGGERGSIGIVVDDVTDLVVLERARVIEHPAGHGRRVRTANVDGSTLSVLGVSEVLDAA